MACVSCGHEKCGGCSTEDHDDLKQSFAAPVLAISLSTADDVPEMETITSVSTLTHAGPLVQTSGSEQLLPLFDRPTRTLPRAGIFHTTPERKPTTYVWFCCECGNGPMQWKLYKECIFCNNHQPCNRCRKEIEK
ncbi:hypothetical protein EJ04DRAFT_513933 [Polyplosphaeria fusca]|uniref:Uncharacterized protein n=1 Tax=Polyplosphaeria fusca TaxID=682080 RepID=A0A9P4V0N7_9PLEO|nr:hypothetical protein EJ04DRAFT_513933 [Polyplosphaeria fusca]